MIYKEILLTRGASTKVSPEDFEYLSQFSWCLGAKGYATKALPRQGSPQKRIRLHNLLLNPPKGMLVDHINRDVLDNRRENLRLVTLEQNQQNAGVRKDSQSGFKGVSWNSHDRCWIATCQANNKRRFLGRFNDKLDAATAYNFAAHELHGPYAVFNLTDQPWLNGGI